MTAVGVGIGYTGSLTLLAEYWRFPAPFTFTVDGLPFPILMNTFILITLGTKDGTRLKALVRYSSSLGIQAALVVAYPAYNALFLPLEGNAQLAFVLVLPVIKYVFKKITAKMHQHDDDLIISLLASVDIFDALYMTKYMQSARTLVVGFAIIVIDVV